MIRLSGQRSAAPRAAAVRSAKAPDRPAALAAAGGEPAALAAAGGELAALAAAGGELAALAAAGGELAALAAAGGELAVSAPAGGELAALSSGAAFTSVMVIRGRETEGQDGQVVVQISSVELADTVDHLVEQLLPGPVRGAERLPDQVHQAFAAEPL
jgi:hypothetical protein